MRRLLLLTLAAGLASPALAQAPGDFDGVYGGAITCEKAGTSPGFVQSLAVVVRDGRFERLRGTPGEPGYEELAGTIAADGAVRIAGRYVAEAEKPILFEGKVEDGALRAAGPRGPRRCEVALDAPKPAGAEPPFKLPPDPEEQRALVTRPPAGAFVCPEAPAPLRDVVVDAFYERGDPSHSVVDAQALAARGRAVEPLTALATGIARLGDRYLQTRPRSEAVAACLSGWLALWAAEGGMLGRVTPQGVYERKWTLVTLALNYGLLADAPEIGADTRGRIEAWLREIAWATVPEYARKPFAEQNNHLNWAALAALATAAATGDRPLFDWGIAAARGALAQVGPDGALPRELARKSKALHYHRFALEPLVLAAEIAATNGVDLASEGDGALDRLVAFTRAGFDEPASVARRVGAAQEFVGNDRFSPSMFGWAEIYLSRHTDAELAATVARLRGTSGLSTTWLGGNLTLRFATARP